MGNNSFGTFSRGTLNLMLALLAIAVAAWVWRRQQIQPAEWIVVATIVIFSAAVAYATCAEVADRHETVPAASPWYTQILLAPVLSLAYLGMMRWRRAGGVLAAVTIALWGWVLIATWTVKLFPMYSGGGSAPMRMRDVWNWYAHGVHSGVLSVTAMAPAGWLYVGMAVSIGLAVGLGAYVIRGVNRG